jgi:hypothetical protein
MRDNLNLEGFKIAQKDIEFVYRLQGPSFKPSGTVAGVPKPGITLVSGAFEVASEVIDFPRQILIDLFKIGGGIIGPPGKRAN